MAMEGYDSTEGNEYQTSALPQVVFVCEKLLPALLHLADEEKL